MWKDAIRSPFDFIEIVVQARDDRRLDEPTPRKTETFSGAKRRI